MLQSICKNIQTLYKAIGNEPVGQIVCNAIRKTVGIKPVLKNVTEVPYHSYVKQQNAKLHKKPIKSIQTTDIDFILIDSGTKENLKLSISSILKQRVSPESVLLVSQNTAFSSEKITVYEDLNIALQDSTSKYVCIANSNHCFHNCFIQELALYSSKNEVDILHTCFDQILDGEQANPNWLPQLNQHLLYSNNYLGSCFLLKRRLGSQLNWFSTKEFKQCYIYDFYLRAIDAGASFYCLPDVLYSTVGEKKVEPIQERKLSLNKHLKRNNWKGELIHGQVPNTLRIIWDIPKKHLVSIIIPFRDKVDLLKDCVDSILKKTDYPNYEIILADNRSEKQETLDYIKQIADKDDRIKHIPVDMEFNFSAINNYAVSKCKGEYVLFLNNDTEVITTSWLSEMVMELHGPKVGVVGAKLLYADNAVQHAGVLYGVGHVAGHAFRQLPDHENGHMNRANLVQEYMAVTGACLMTKKDLFLSFAGFDEENLKVAYNDVDLCLKIGKVGYKVIYTPYSKLYHFESKTRERDLSKNEAERYKNECKYMDKKWRYRDYVDPFFHEYLNTKHEKFII